MGVKTQFHLMRPFCFLTRSCREHYVGKDYKALSRLNWRCLPGTGQVDNALCIRDPVCSGEAAGGKACDMEVEKPGSVPSWSCDNPQ